MHTKGEKTAITPPPLKSLQKYIPRPSDSKRQVSSTPKSRHQDKKLAVLSRAKKEPEGALALHGIFFRGKVWKIKKSQSGGVLGKVISETH